MTTISRYVLYDILRNKVLVAYMLFLLIVSMSLFQMEENSSKAMCMLTRSSISKLMRTANGVRIPVSSTIAALLLRANPRHALVPLGACRIATLNETVHGDGRRIRNTGSGDSERGTLSVLKLRLRRMGAKRQPSYRIVVAESSSPRDGRFLETVGMYNPKTEPMTLRVDAERAKYWLERGAQPTDTVRSLLVRTGVVPGRISKEGIAEGYVTEVPRRGVTPTIMPAQSDAAAVAE